MQIKITEDMAGKTIREIVSGLKFSTRLLTRLKKLEDGITVNGEHKTVRYVVSCGDILTLALEDTDSSCSITPYHAPVKLLWEDEWYAAYAKPAGLPTHPARRHQNDTLAARIMAAREEENFVFRALTRLDLDTSGAVIIAKNQLAANEFSKLLISRSVKKEYIAVCHGKIDADEGEITYRIHRPDKKSIIRETTDDTNLGEEAITLYHVIKKSEDYSLVLANIITGRTHQIRVHMKALSHPIVGDTLYNTPSEIVARQALHAFRISFTHPFTKKTISVRCPLFEDMEMCIRSLFGEIEWS